MIAKTLRVGGLAALCALSAQEARAADEFDIDEAPAQSPAKKPVPMNEAGVDVGYQFGGSAAFNRFTGTPDNGLWGGGWFHLQQRETGPEGGTFYLKMDGENIDFRSQSLPADASAALRTGEQGKWDLRFSYDGIPFRQSDNYHSLFDSSGRLNTGLTAGAISTTAATGVPAANRTMGVYDVGTRRDRAGGAFTYAGLEDWTFTTKLDHEHKHGTKANAVMFMSNYSFASILEPVNYDTDRLTLSAAYTTKAVQSRFSYIYSSFTNNVSEWKGNDPFTGATHAGYDGTRFSLPPSNSEHRWKAQNGINFGENVRLATNLSYGLQLQDESFTARHYEQAARLTENHAQTKIQTLYGNTVLTVRPVRDVNLRAAYTIDDRDNLSKTYWQKPPYRADGTAVFNGNTGIHTNQPYSFLNQKGELEASWRVAKALRLITEYAYRNDQRDYSVTNRNEENTYGARLAANLSEATTGTLGYSRSARDAQAYLGNRGWNTLGRTVTAESDLVMYNYAARRRDEIKANVNTAFENGMVLGATARWIEDRFPKTVYGVTNNHALSLGADAAFPMGAGLNGHLFYSFVENYTGTKLNASATGTLWTLHNTDGTHVVGGGLEWKASDDLKFTLDNVLTYGNTSFEEGSQWRGTGTASAANIATNLPDVRSLLNTLKLTGEYQVSEGMFLGLTGLWERYCSKDYLNYQLAASTANASTATVVNAAEGNPGYSAGALIVSARMQW